MVWKQQAYLHQAAAAAASGPGLSQKVVMSDRSAASQELGRMNHSLRQLQHSQGGTMRHGVLGGPIPQAPAGDVVPVGLLDQLYLGFN